MGCTYLSLPKIPASPAKALTFRCEFEPIVAVFRAGVCSQPTYVPWWFNLFALNCYLPGYRPSVIVYSAKYSCDGCNMFFDTSNWCMSTTLSCLEYIPWNMHTPDSNVHGANMGPIWGRQGPCGPHVGPMNFAIWDGSRLALFWCGFRVGQ